MRFWREAYAAVTCRAGLLAACLLLPLLSSAYMSLHALPACMTELLGGTLRLLGGGFTLPTLLHLSAQTLHISFSATSSLPHSCLLQTREEATRRHTTSLPCLHTTCLPCSCTHLLYFTGGLYLLPVLSFWGTFLLRGRKPSSSSLLSFTCASACISCLHSLPPYAVSL